MLKSLVCCFAVSLIGSSAVIAQNPPGDQSALGSTDFLDARNGFRGVEFGTDFAKFSGLKVDRDHGKLKMYTKEGDKLSLGLATLEDIVYHFFDGKFYGVSLHAGDKPNGDTLRAIIFTAFGPGQKLDDHNTLWEGSKAWAELSENPDTGQVTVFIGSNEIAQKLGDYEQKAAEQATSEL